jgi:NADPH-dependent curcumin reductase CurA
LLLFFRKDVFFSLTITETETMRQFLLAARPRGRAIRDDDFTLVQAAVPKPAAGEVLLRTRWLGFDPAQKGWMENFADYTAPMAIGDVMRGSGIGEVVESHCPDLAVGDLVEGPIGWSEYVVLPPGNLTLVEPSLPPTAMLSLLGITGLTAWHGFFEVGRPRAGDTVVVSGAAGATGSVVVQLARIAGCRVVAIAGGAEKCQWLTETAGADIAVDYRQEDFRDSLRAALPRGADVVYDNVGGGVLNTMLEMVANGARIVICGAISRYETAGSPLGPSNYFNVVLRRATMAGFIVIDHTESFPRIRQRLTEFAAQGRLVWQVDEQVGFENAPATFRRLFTGENRGKQVLRVE